MPTKPFMPLWYHQCMVQLVELADGVREAGQSTCDMFCLRLRMRHSATLGACPLSCTTKAVDGDGASRAEQPLHADGDLTQGGDEAEPPALDVFVSTLDCMYKLVQVDARSMFFRSTQCAIEVVRRRVPSTAADAWGTSVRATLSRCV